MRLSATAGFTIILTALLASCTSTDEGPATEGGLTDSRHGVAGDEVASICFNREISSWQELTRDSIVLERGLDDYYRVELAGPCEPRDAFLSLRVESRDGICLGTGDEIDFPDDNAPSCTIRRINEWIPTED